MPTYISVIYLVDIRQVWGHHQGALEKSLDRPKKTSDWTGLWPLPIQLLSLE